MFINTLSLPELMVFYYEKYLQAKKQNKMIEANKYLQLARKYKSRLSNE